MWEWAVECNDLIMFYGLMWEWAVECNDLIMF